MKLCQFLNESPSFNEVQEIVRKVLKKHFSGENLTVPEIKIVNNLGSIWLARHVCRINKLTGNKQAVIEIQKSIMDDEATLERVITHELIHHWQCSQLTAKNGVTYNRMAGHGKEFLDWAAKINAKTKPNYVTIKSDEEYLQVNNKEFYVIIAPYIEGKFMYGWFQRPSAKMRERINSKVDLGAKIFKSTDIKLLNGLKFSEGFGIPKSEERQVMIKNIFNSGKGIGKI